MNPLIVLLMLASIGASTQVFAENLPTDPLNSSQWPAMYRAFLTKHPVVFDDRVRVSLPAEAEDPMQVPVSVRFDAIDRPQQLLVFIDYNPLPKALRYEITDQMAPFLGFSVRVQQSTPIRVAVLDGDNVWRVNGGWVSAAGGGCTLPNSGLARFDEDKLLDIRARQWPRDDGHARLRFRVVHPMDTGLVANRAAYFVETVTIKNAAGEAIAQLHPFEPISENPLFTLETRQFGTLTLEGRDNQGLDFRHQVVQ